MGGKIGGKAEPGVRPPGASSLLRTLFEAMLASSLFHKAQDPSKGSEGLEEGPRSPPEGGLSLHHTGGCLSVCERRWGLLLPFFFLFL